MEKLRRIVTSEEETQDLAEKLAAHLRPGMVIWLEGDLGAGKTTFTKGLARGLGIQRVVKSPSYTLVREYQEGNLPLYHIDLYRLEDGGADDLGLDDYFYSTGITVVEWGSVAPDVMPDHRLDIHLIRQEDLQSRELLMESRGEDYDRLLQNLEADLGKSL